MYNTGKEVCWLARGGWICPWCCPLLSLGGYWCLWKDCSHDEAHRESKQTLHYVYIYIYICKGCTFWSQNRGSRLCWWSPFFPKILACFLSNAIRSLPCWGSLTPSRGQHSPACVCTATCWVSFICFLSWWYCPSWGRRFSEMDRTQVTGSSRKSFPGLFTPGRFRAAI